MKISGNGQAKILSTIELQALFERGFKCERDRALFAICFFTACRISEALQLRKNSIKADRVVFFKSTTKGKLGTREVTINSDLRQYLEAYQSPKPWNPYYFPGYEGHLKINQAHRILKVACERVGIVGASTHSFRRTALTRLHKQGVPLRIIQTISGHKSLATLQKYLEVTEEEKEQAISLLSWQDI